MMTKKNVKNYHQFVNEDNNRINSNKVKPGDVVSYEKLSGGYDIVQGIKRAKKSLKTGTVIGKIPSNNNMAPKFMIKNDQNSIEEIFVDDVVEILKSH